DPSGVRPGLAFYLLDPCGACLRSAERSDSQGADARPGLSRVRSVHRRAVWRSEAEGSDRRLVEHRAPAAEGCFISKSQIPNPKSQVANSRSKSRVAKPTQSSVELQTEF